MAKTVVIDELIVTLRVPAGLPDAEAEAVRQTLTSPAFLDRVRAAVSAALAPFPELAVCRAAVAR